MQTVNFPIVVIITIRLVIRKIVHVFSPKYGVIGVYHGFIGIELGDGLNIRSLYRSYKCFHNPCQWIKDRRTELNITLNLRSNMSIFFGETFLNLLFKSREKCIRMYAVIIT